MKTQIQKSDDSSQGIRPSSFGLRHWLVLLPLVVASLAPAQTVPPFINYQGKVADSAGVGLGTPTPLNRKVLFRIYDAAAAGTLLYTEEQTVTLSGGEFSVLIGQGIAFQSEPKPALDTVFTSAGVGRFLEITVDNGDSTINASDAPITPRQKITSTAYAFRARSADTVADNAIGSAAIANGAITQLKLATSSVNSSTIASNAVDSSKIVDATIVLADLASNAVDSSKIVDGSIATADLANGSVTAAKLGGDVGLWTLTGGDVFRASGRVGIGLTTVGANTKFHVRDSLPVTTDLGQWRSLSAVSGPTNAVVLGELDVNGTTAGGEVAVIGGHNAALDMWTPLAINPGGGNVGIGTSSPGARLHVGGSSSKASSATSSLLALGTSDAANPFGMTISVTGNATLANRRVALQTSDIGSTSGGNLTLQALGGNVGIGEANPTKAKLVIQGVGSEQNFLGNHTLYGQNLEHGLYPNHSEGASLVCSNAVHAGWYRTNSDARIKIVKGISNGADDLKALLGLKITDYVMKDAIENGNRPKRRSLPSKQRKSIPKPSAE
jgi:hypothetical protein